jgi:hypothetical protein
MATPVVEIVPVCVDASADLFELTLSACSLHSVLGHTLLGEEFVGESQVVHRRRRTRSGLSKEGYPQPSFYIPDLNLATLRHGRGRYPAPSSVRDLA